jgi:hypothetical protein
MNKPKGTRGKNPQKKANPIAPYSGATSSTHSTNPLVGKARGGS